MISLIRQSKALVLIIKDFEVQLLLWEAKVLSLIEVYADFQDSKDRFDRALHQYSDYPLIIIADVIEESFRNETVVHVAATDRKALLDRKLSYSFRNTRFRSARITGREESGRRDDKVMLSAITKPELVNPWVDKLLSMNRSIQSISSMAYLTESYLSSVGGKVPEHLMLISIGDSLNLRQTYIKKGKVLFSRLTTLASLDVSALGENIYQESLQIRKYLERIRLLSYEDSLEIRVYTPYDKSSLASFLHSSTSNSFECFDSREETLLYNLELQEAKPSGLYLFLANALQNKRIENIYANLDVKRYFYLKKIAQGMTLGASVLVVLSMMINAPTLSDTLDKQSLQEAVEAQSIPLRAEYERLSQRFPETPIDSKEMALVVETSETIRKQSYMPMDAMNLISQALAQSPDLEVSSIEWKMVENEAEQSADQGFFGYSPPQEVVPGAEFIQAVLDERTSLKVVLEGVAFSPRSYREAQEQVQRLVNALEAFPGVSVVPLKLPTDVRVDTRVSTTVDDDELRADYSLELTLEAVE